MRIFEYTTTTKTPMPSFKTGEDVTTTTTRRFGLTREFAIGLAVVTAALHFVFHVL